MLRQRSLSANSITTVIKTSLNPKQLQELKQGDEQVHDEKSSARFRQRKRSQSDDRGVLKAILRRGVPVFDPNDPPFLPTLGETQQESKNATEVAAQSIPLDQVYDRYGFIVTDSTTSNSLVRTRQVQRIETPEEIKKKTQIETLRARKWSKMVQSWDYTAKKRKKKLKSRIRKGIPDAFRAKVWIHLAGSRKIREQNSSLYSDLVGKSSRGQLMDVEHQKVRESILRDITRTFPRHVIFQNQDGLGQRALLKVLQAYALYDQQVGYCQGMGFIVGLLLGYMTEEDAFWMLVALMQGERFHMKELFKPGMTGAQCLLSQFGQLLKLFLPDLAAHLENENIVPSMYATHWFITLFSYSFPFDVVVRIWDVFLSEGWKAMFRVTLAIIKMHHDNLMTCHFEQILEFFRSMPPTIDVDKLLAVAFKLKLKTSQIDEAAKKFHKEANAQ